MTGVAAGLSRIDGIEHCRNLGEPRREGDFTDPRSPRLGIPVRRHPEVLVSRFLRSGTFCENRHSAAPVHDGVNAGSLALMAAVTWQLCRTALVDVVTIMLAVVSSGTIVVALELRVACVYGGGRRTHRACFSL